MAAAIPQNQSTFSIASKYALASLAVSTVGALTAVGASATAIKISGIVLALMGSYAFVAILISGFINYDSPEKFKLHLKEVLLMAMGQAIAEICSQVAIHVLHALIEKCLCSNRS